MRNQCAIAGDGSVLMYGGDITVAVQENLPVIFVILNDSEYGMVRHGQQLGHAEKIGYKLPEINFSEYASSMGVKATIIKSLNDLQALNIKEICSRPGPTILDVRIDKQEVPPMDNRLKALGTMDGLDR